MLDFDSIYAIAVVGIPIVTNYVKSAVPKRLWPLIPFALGALVAGIWGSDQGVQMQALLTDAFLLGGVGTMLYSAHQAATNGGKPEVTKKRK